MRPLNLSRCLSVSATMAGSLGDVRKLFLFTTTQNYFGLRPELWDQPPLNNCPEVNNFLDDGNQMLLRVQRSDAGLAFSNTVRRWRGAARRGLPCPACPGPASSPFPQVLGPHARPKDISALPRSHGAQAVPALVVECPPDSRSFPVHTAK